MWGACLAGTIYFSTLKRVEMVINLHRSLKKKYSSKLEDIKWKCTKVNRKIRTRGLIPPWKMPSDPVKAVFWFMHWLLKVLVNFFWLPVIIMIIIETCLNWMVGGVVNGLVGGSVTLLVGVVAWAILYGLLQMVNIGTGVTQVISDVNRMQQDALRRRPFSPFTYGEADEGNVVEGTITDLEQERKKRRRENLQE